MAEICFDVQRRVCIKIEETPKHIIYITIDKEKGKRVVTVKQLSVLKFNSTYTAEVTKNSIRDIVEKWQNLTTLGVIITPAARHAFAELLKQENSAMATPPKKAEPKKEAKTASPPKKAEPKKEVKKIELSKRKKIDPKAVKDDAVAREGKKPAPKKEEPKKEASDKSKKPTVVRSRRSKASSDIGAPGPGGVQQELPFDTAVVMSAPPGTKLKAGKTINGKDPESHTQTSSIKELSMATSKKPEPVKKSQKPEPSKATSKKPEPAKSTTKKTSEAPRSKGGDIAGKKIKPVAKADLSLVREGTVRMLLMKAVIASGTVEEALKKTVKRTDGEKMAVNTTHIKMAAEYGFITLS